MTKFDQTSGAAGRWRLTMRIGFAFSVALYGLSLTTTPAAAAKLDQVRAICAKNPACHAIPQDPRFGGQDFCIDSPPGGSVCDALVWCPGDGSDCGVIKIVAGKRKLMANSDAGALLNSR